MNEEEAFRLVNNLDWEDKKRRFAPKWSLVTYSRNGIIEDVQRFKETPQTKEQSEIMKRFPQSLQFTAWPGRFSTPKHIRQEISESIRVLTVVELPENKGKRWVKA